jgi:hypothetical protein
MKKIFNLNNVDNIELLKEKESRLYKYKPYKKFLLWKRKEGCYCYDSYEGLFKTIDEINNTKEYFFKDNKIYIKNRIVFNFVNNSYTKYFNSFEEVMNYYNSIKDMVPNKIEINIIDE